MLQNVPTPEKFSRPFFVLFQQVPKEPTSSCIPVTLEVGSVADLVQITAQLAKGELKVMHGLTLELQMLVALAAHSGFLKQAPIT